MTKLKRISTWVSQEFKEAFSAVAKQNETTESALLNKILHAFLKQNKVEEQPKTVSSNELKNKRLTIRLTENEEQELHNRSLKRSITRSTYLSSLFRAHIKSSPVFLEDELVALREANRQLAALGKNINQIAKALNISKDNAHLVSAIDLNELRDSIEAHRTFIVNLVQENMTAWGVANNGN